MSQDSSSRTRRTHLGVLLIVLVASTVLSVIAAEDGRHIVAGMWLVAQSIACIGLFREVRVREQIAYEEGIRVGREGRR